jgi:quinol monooxygenase YgiN
MIYVIATVTLQPDGVAAFLAAFTDLAPEVRREDGCLEYTSTLDVASGLARQAPHRPNVVTIVERWKDLPSLSAHLVAPHMLTYRERVGHLVLSTSLQVLAPQSA